MQFLDLDLSLSTHPIKQDITPLKDNEAIKKSIKNILLTQHYERPFEPSFGSLVNSLLFEPMVVPTTISLKKSIETALTNFEPRISIQSVEVNPNYDKSYYEVDIFYYIVNIDDIQEFNLFLERPR